MSRTLIELSPLSSALPKAVVRSRPGEPATSVDHVATPLNGTLQVPLESSTIQVHPESSTILQGEMSKVRAVVLIAIVASMTAMNSMLSGMLTVALPTIARDLALKENLLLWPASVYALTCGCTLLLSGSIADVVGSRPMYLAGCVLLTVFTLGCGLSRTGIQLIVFRALSGIAISFCLPSAVSIITGSFSTGQRRNVAFSCLGAAQPVGFSLGLVVGGVLADRIGWRYGYYIVTIANIITLLMAVWRLPKNPRDVMPVTWSRLVYDIDWIGALLASSSLGMLSYVFAAVTGSVSSLRDPSNIALLCVAVALLPAFVFWVGRQERLDRPAIIPNSLWRNTIFTCVCISVFFSWAVFYAMQYFMTLFFQDVQGLSAIQTSLRFLPMVFSGTVTNIVTGLLVPSVSANLLISVTVGLTSLSSLLMALIDKSWPYWYMAFAVTLLTPIGADTLFTISNLVITSVFPARTQGLAGGVFNTLAQIGTSVGLAVSAVIASSVTSGSGVQDKMSPEALMKGYRATFWACFAALVMMLGVSGWGLRRIGKVGLKQD